MRALASLLLIVPLAACATLPATRDTPFLPAGVFGTYQDNDIGALNQSAWAFAAAAHTQGNPIEAARAIVALEYLSGELVENPRWAGMDASVKVRIGQARDALRALVGIRPDAPPQMVVDALLALCWDLETGNQPAALQVLGTPVFTAAPAVTLRTLSDLPYMKAANLATARAAVEEFPPGGRRG
jgi:hypothetical protein